MALIDKRILETRMMEIERARPLGTRVISKFEQLIRDGDDLSLYRINPLAFARDRTIGEAESIDLFLHARQKRRRAAVAIWNSATRTKPLFRILVATLYSHVGHLGYRPV